MIDFANPNDVSAKVVNVSDTDAEIALANNTIFNCGELDSLEITAPAAANLDPAFISQVNFTSGNTATELTWVSTEPVWTGDDVDGGVFVPDSNKRYTLLFYFDGVHLIGISKSVEIPATDPNIIQPLGE